MSSSSSDLELFERFIAHDDFVDFMCELVPFLPDFDQCTDQGLFARIQWLKDTDLIKWSNCCTHFRKDGKAIAEIVRYNGEQTIKRFAKRIVDDKKFYAQFESFYETLELRELSKKQALLNTESQALAKQIEERTAKKRKRESTL
jgi:hypothetical protein